MGKLTWLWVTINQLVSSQFSHLDNQNVWYFISYMTWGVYMPCLTCRYTSCQRTNLRSRGPGWLHKPALLQGLEICCRAHQGSQPSLRSETKPSLRAQGSVLTRLISFHDWLTAQLAIVPKFISSIIVSLSMPKSMKSLFLRRCGSIELFWISQDQIFRNTLWCIWQIIRFGNKYTTCGSANLVLVSCFKIMW